MSYFTNKERFPPAVVEQEFALLNNSMRLNSMLDVCKEKCFKKFDNGEDSVDYMTRGEILCTDRCVKKFFSVAQMLDKMSKKRMEEMQSTGQDLAEGQEGQEGQS